MRELIHYADALPRLEAEEQLAAITSVSVGSGMVKKHEANRVMRELRRSVHGRRARKAGPSDLRAIGIGYDG